MLRKIGHACFLLLIVQAGQAQGARGNLERPKLVVGIVVDQMRWDYLYRFHGRYGEGGFRRMLQEGFSCEATYINYVPTVTAIGHSTLYTGSVPAFHGIAGNDFIDNATGRNMYCTGDSSVQTVGSSSLEGRMSPRNLLSTTITDELKLATNFHSKVIGVALKDRGSILPAGHTADAAYWFDNESGNWISSTYYMQKLPDWLVKFNAQRWPDRYLKEGWNTLYPVNTYMQSAPDNNTFEGRFPGQQAPVFPIRFTGQAAKEYEWVRHIPAGNTMTFEMAKQAIEHEKLGQGEQTDFLAISCSATDYIGHKFGVNSVEAEDTYLRLDRDLAGFFSALDQQLGKDNYLIFLSADHGAAHNAGFLKEHGIPAGWWPASQYRTELNTELQRKYGIADLVLNFNNYQVRLNLPLIHERNLDLKAIHQDCKTFLLARPGVAFVVDVAAEDFSGLPPELADRIRRGYNPQRSGSLTIILQSGWYPGLPGGTGSTHAAWNNYDAHIPLLWMGWKIRAGVTRRETYMTDVAATLAALLHIQAPSACIGKPIHELFNDQ